MKRRGTNRRQVLDLDTNSSSPKRSWQTKYQQIYSDHLKNTASTATQEAPPAPQNGSDSSESRLLQLVGYTSDSEGDESNIPSGDIDSKVQDFLKEISDIVPTAVSNPDVGSIDDESSRESIKKSKSKSKKGIGPTLPECAEVQAQPLTVQGSDQQPTIAWQECYDENSGCYYFWNIETNEVTWEMPEALRAYHVALEQWNAQQLMLAQQAAGAGIQGYTSQSSNQQQQKKQGANKQTEKTKNKRSKPADSDSEEEKIELITSYGPNSDDDSDSSSSHHSSKKKKVESSKTSKKEKKKEKQKDIAIGPQLPPGYIIPVEIKEAKPAVTEKPPSVPEKTDEIPTEPKTKKTTKKEIAVKVKSIDPTEVVETDTKDTPWNTTQKDVNKVNALKRLKSLKSKTSESSSSEDSDSSSSNDSNKDKMENIKENEDKDNEEGDEEEEEDDEDVEDSILERLKNQAKILKELGGEIPEEIKELIETTSDSDKYNVPTPPIGEETQVDMQVEENSEGIWPDIEAKTDKNDDVVSEKITDVKNESIVETNLTDKPPVELEAESKDVKIIQSAPPAVPAVAVLSEVKKPPEVAPTSFSLIAGYGNEDDSETEEEKSEEIKSKVNGKPAPLFPIVPVVEEGTNVDQVDIKGEKAFVKNTNMKVIKLSAKAKELIHSSTTTEKARATEFVATADGLKLASSLIKENEVLVSEPRGFPEPVKKVSRKKRLEVPVIRKKKEESPLKVEDSVDETSSDKKLEPPVNDTRQNTPEESAENVEAASKSSSTPYTSTWAYNSELRGGEYRGFGYGHDFESDQKSKPKKGMIQFVKSDTLMPKNVPVVNVPEKQAVVEGTKQEDESPSDQKEQTKELAQLITEKVKFLCEGKEIVTPVQVMAIQLETLTTAHSAGGLSVQYLWQWLTSLDVQLASLEQAAAPQGWRCQWDRFYKRYYYRNEATDSIQWEYPEIGTIASAGTEEPHPAAPTQGGEEAMELCDSPPPPQPPSTPPPPRISMTRTPSPSLPVEPAPPLPPMPPPPPVISEQPPLPPLPPSESPPPPPLPPSPPPPPPPPVISIAPGEPLPPGVDLPEELYEAPRPPLPSVPPPPPATPPPPPPPPDISGESVDQPVFGMGYDVPMHYDNYQIQKVSTDFGSGVYPYTEASSGGDDTYVIARPPASNPVPPPPATNLANELDSFYNEVAALDPPLPPPEPSPSPPPPPVSPPPPQPQPVVADVTGKKKKKTKLAPGLALKKKGVSSLVAKWQQVQQDVRREAANEETQS